MQNISLITIDVEEWYQVENLRSEFPNKIWTNQNSTVLKNINKILNILDKFGIKATFFILGLIAENNPEVVRIISQSAHEIASHGTGHDLTYNLNANELYNDIKSSKDKLEKISGQQVLGYRAPNFSISQKLIEILKNLKFHYDSSYNPFQLNSRYGKIDINSSVEGGIYNLDNNFYEIPLSTLRIFNQNIPMAGGAYFRIYPFPLFKEFVKAKLRKNKLYHFYLHPWEFEPEQPRIKNIKFNYRLRHYTGLKYTKIKFEKLIQFLQEMDCQFLTISDYIEKSKIKI